MHHILLAEDDQAIAEVVTLILQDAGYTVDIPSNYEHIDTLLRTKSYDVILLDMWLWGKNGADICVQIKNSEDMKHIPVIFLSAQNDATQIGKDIHADDILPKPFDMQVLLEKVKKQIKE